MSTETESILTEVQEERKRQDEKWGEQDHPPCDWLMILGEEVGEANEAALEHKFGDWPIDRYRKELIQVAAVAVAAVECLDRQRIEGVEGGEVVSAGGAVEHRPDLRRRTGLLLHSKV